MFTEKMVNKAKDFLTDNNIVQVDSGCSFKNGDSTKYLAVHGELKNYFDISRAHLLVYAIGHMDDYKITAPKGSIRIIHSCGNKNCLNLDHLYKITSSEYLRKAHRKRKENFNTYNYYNKGNYIFYNKKNNKRIFLDKKEYIVEKGVIFHIRYVGALCDEIVKTKCPNIGILTKGEILSCLF